MTRTRASGARPTSDRRDSTSARRFDGVTLSLYQGLFAACAEEMGITLMRTAHSPNIKERLDHSCAIFDGTGQLVAQAAHIPVHLGSLPRAVEAAIAIGPFRRGDTVILNDPYAGGTHLPDVTLVSPVFLGHGPPDFFVASRAHHADVGGAAPGSMPVAREIYEEGLRIPPVFLERRGVSQRDVLALVLANVRTAEERRADLAAQMGAQRTGAARLADLARRASRAEVVAAADALIAHAERCVRAALAELPDGEHRFEDVLDDDGLGNGPLRIAVRLALTGDRAVVDFAGTSPQAAGPVNAVEAVARAAVTYVFRCVLGGDFPINAGAFRPIEIVTPEGSLVGPRLPGAVGAGNVETSQRIVDVVLGAFAHAVPERIPAASSGTMNNLLIGGIDPRTGRAFSYYETLAGGHGAGPGWHGESALQAHMTNTRNTPVESLEHAYPLRVAATRIRRGSGGAGRWRGGDGVERTLELLADARVTVISDRRTRGPYGASGGDAGMPGSNQVRKGGTRVALDPRAGDEAMTLPRDAEEPVTREGRAQTKQEPRVASPSANDGAELEMPGKFQVDLPAGTVLTVASPGGGGFGRLTKKKQR